MAGMSDDKRNDKQRDRQQKLREANRKARRPDRDDVARTALFVTISSKAAKGVFEDLDEFHERVVMMLVEQGFDEQASDQVFDELVAKYRTGIWPFRRKVHLLYSDDADRDG